MKKTTYIAPSTSVHMLNVKRGILLSASDGTNRLLGNGGTTSGNVTVSDARDNAWDIWGTGEDFED